MQMTSVMDNDLIGAFNLLISPEELDNYNRQVDRFRELIRGLSPIIEMECMSEYDYILEVYDRALVAGQAVINNEFPKATTEEEFKMVNAKMKNSVEQLEAVDRVLEFSFRNNFIRFF